MRTLRQEVGKFKAWADRYYTFERRQGYGEWECDYTEWDGLYDAVLTFLASSPSSNWDDNDVNDLLYAIARDNETEYLADEVAKNTDRLLRLSGLALSSSERDAKWQLSVRLGGLSSRAQEAEALLLQFVDDEDEYVCRRALLALGKPKSPSAETLAERAWDTGHEYQRIAALWVLKDISSDKLPVYIEKATDDGREYVVYNARKIQQAEETIDARPDEP